MDFLVVGSSIAFIAYLLATVAVLSRLFHPQGPNLKLALVLAFIAITTHLSNDFPLYTSDAADE